MDYRIEIADVDFNLLEFLEDEALNISWGYNRIGGCAGFSFDLPRRFNDQGNVSGDFDIKIFRRIAAGTYSLIFSGFVEDRSPTFAEPEKINVRGYGYSAHLSRVIVNANYQNQEISSVVRTIMDDFVVPNTGITYQASDIVNTGFTAGTLDFNTTAMNALRTLAEIVGTQEWGVDEDRNFFFKPRSDTINFYFTPGYKVINFSSVDSFRDIVNRIRLEGGDVSGTIYKRTINSASSQSRWGLREKIVQNSAIISDDVADRYGAAILAEKATLIRRGKITIVGDDAQIEATIPVGTAQFKESGVRYNEEKYSTFLYSGEVAFQINKISYKIDTDKTLIKTLDLGELRPALAQEVSRLDFELDNLRAAR